MVLIQASFRLSGQKELVLAPYDCLPMSVLNFPPFSAASAFCISPQYFHLLALPLTALLQKEALVSAYSATGKTLLFVYSFHGRCKQRKVLYIKGLKLFLPTLFVHPSSCFKEDDPPPQRLILLALRGLYQLFLSYNSFFRFFLNNCIFFTQNEMQKNKPATTTRLQACFHIMFLFLHQSLIIEFPHITTICHRMHSHICHC